MRTALDRHDLRLPAVLEKRLHRLAEDDLVVRCGAGCAPAPSPAQSRMVWKTRRVLTGVSLTPGVTPGPDHHQRHVHRRLIDQIAVLRLAMIAEPFAMIADDDHDAPAPARCCSNAWTTRPICSSIAATSPRYGAFGVLRDR